MAIPVVDLSELSLLVPKLVGTTLSVDSGVVPFTILGDTNTIFVVISYEETTLTLTATPYGNKNKFEGSLQLNTIGETVTIRVVGRNWDSSNPLDPNLSTPRSTPTFSFDLLYTKFEENDPRVNPPSGVKIHKRFGTCRVEWATPTNPGFIGVRLMWSKDPSGANVPYYQQGHLITKITRTDSVPIVSDTVTQKNVEGTQVVTTTTQQVATTNFSSFDFSPEITGDEQEFYVVLSTVVQDPLTNHIYESSWNGPFRCGYVDLRKATPTDYPYLQAREDIAGRMISEIYQVYPDIDLSPRSELRDLFIDPASIEISEMSTREWFARCSSSVSALSSIDDADGDGFSDPVGSSQIKQQLARAWHLNFTDIQALIDKQFDLLGEWAGLTRGGSQSAITTLTFASYTKPIGRTIIESGSIVATIPDNETAAVQFIATGSAVLDASNLDSFYDAARGWWAVTVPAQCLTPGSLGNVGAETIRQPVSGIPQGFMVTNLAAADFGRDIEPNSRFAERIADRLIVGVDPGSRNGYLSATRAVPNVTEARVVASGDLEMLRDWDPIRHKHIFGTVDVYVRGLNSSQENQSIPFTYELTSPFGSVGSYSPLTLQDRNKGSFRIDHWGTFTYTPFQALEIRVTRGANTFYLGVNNSQVDYTRGLIYLDLSEKAYQITGTSYSERRIPVKLGTILEATNAQLLTSISGQLGSFTVSGVFRTFSPISNTPRYQPVTGVNSLAGEEEQSGVLDSAKIRLIHKTDPLLEGGSNKAQDEVRFDSTHTSVTIKTLQFEFGGSDTVKVDDHIYLGVQETGSLEDFLAVRSGDQVTKYVYGSDYSIVRSGPYGEYSLVRIPTSTIPFDENVLVSYNKLSLHERLTYIPEESLVLNGTTFTPLANRGVVHNIWLPESYKDFTLSMDGYSEDPNLASGLYKAQVPKSWRYIKVTFNDGTQDVIMRENVDYVLQYIPSTGTLGIGRLLSGRLPDGASLKVSYFKTEVFSLVTQYPGYVQQVSSVLESTRHAAADILVKAMTENKVDMALTVEIDPSSTPDVVDPRIRTAITLVLDQAKNKLTQSEVIRQIKGIQGVTNVEVPMTKFAKSDGSYDIGLLIPSGTSWTPVVQDAKISSRIPSIPARTFVTTNPVLINRTIPSGGLADAYVGLLYEGIPFTRLSKLSDLSKGLSPAFYIIGVNDTVDGLTMLDSSYIGKVVVSLPSDMINPTTYAFRVTYQVWAEGGYKDILMSPSEFLRPGRITIDYVLAKKGIVLS